MGSRTDNWRLPSEEYLKLRPNYREGTEDEAMVKEMAEAVASVDTPYTKDPVMLLRFIRARGNVKEAVAQFTKMAEWRRNLGADSLTEEDVPAMIVHHHYNANGIFGVAKDGHLISWQHPALEDYCGRVSSCGGMENIYKGMCFGMDSLDRDLRDHSVRLGRVVDQMLVIPDLSGLSLSLVQPQVLSIYKMRMAAAEQNFPERAWKIRVINPPSIFAIVYDYISGSLSENTQKKIHVLHSPKDLKELIDDEEIPEYLGGKKRIHGDPYCRYALKATTEYVKVPENAPAAATADRKYMLCPVELKTNVPSRGYYVDFRVVPAGTVMKWSFNLPYYDISLCIKVFKDGGPLEGDVVHEETKVKEARGEFPACGHDCTYEFKFDNSFSYITSKDIVFTFDKA